MSIQAEAERIEGIRDLLASAVAASEKASPPLFWTIKRLSELVGLIPDSDFLAALIGMAGNGKAFEMHFSYRGKPIDDEAVKLAYENGYLTCPIDGREIQDFEAVLVPYFVYRGAGA